MTQIKFTFDKRGRMLAHRSSFSRNMRWVRMSVVEAMQQIGAGQAQDASGAAWTVALGLKGRVHR